ncbi:MAG: hypothetical protein PGN11_03320 [Quadrisphaera sp.]
MVTWIASAALVWLVVAAAAAVLIGRGLTTCEARERLAEPAAEPQPVTHRPAPRPRPRGSHHLAGVRRVVVPQPVYSHR